MDLSRESFTNKKSSSLLYYTPKSQMDYGTVLCVASNVVGRQIVPCIYHVIPAGMTQWVQTNSGSAIGILCTCIFTRFSKKNHPATIVCTEIQGNISWKCWSMKIRGCLQNWFHFTLIDMKIKVVWSGISWSYVFKNYNPFVMHEELYQKQSKPKLVEWNVRLLIALQLPWINREKFWCHHNYWWIPSTIIANEIFNFTRHGNCFSGIPEWNVRLSNGLLEINSRKLFSLFIKLRLNEIFFC